MRSTAGSIGDWLTDPAPVLPGMIEVSLDSGGRLRSFSAVPPERSNSKATAAQPDWRPLLEAAGFDPGTLEPMQPTWSPPVFADSVVAYAAVYPDAPDVNVQIHAASLDRKSVV